MFCLYIESEIWLLVRKVDSCEQHTQQTRLVLCEVYKGAAVAATVKREGGSRDMACSSLIRVITKVALIKIHTHHFILYCDCGMVSWRIWGLLEGWSRLISQMRWRFFKNKIFLIVHFDMPSPIQGKAVLVETPPCIRLCLYCATCTFDFIEAKHKQTIFTNKIARSRIIRWNLVFYLRTIR